MASIDGIVADNTGAVIAGAQVEIRNTQTGLVQKQTTGSGGLFSYPNLEPGKYVLTVKAEGMENLVRTGIELTTGVTNSMQLNMKIGSSAQTVTVSAGTQTTNLTDATISNLVNTEQVKDMPLNVRSFASLVRLEPGVTPGGITNSESSANTDAGGFIAGQRSFDVGYTVDGGNVMSNTWPQPVWVITANGGISIDAIHEFRIFTSNKPVDGGGKSGGLVQVTTKSGTDKFHGSVFEYFRNTIFDARNYFDEKRLPYHQNQFGGTLGGPAWKNKAYFFGSYEAFRASQTLSSDITVPTPRLLSLIPAGASNGYLRELMQAAYPAATSAYSSTDLVGTANSTYDNSNNRNMGLGRMDIQLPKNNQLTLRYMQVAGKSGYGATTFVGTNGANVGQDWSADNALIRLISPLSNNLVNEVHFDYDRNVTAFIAAPTPAAVLALGFSNDSNSAYGMPTINFTGTGLAQVGPPSWLPLVRHENSYEAADNISWSHGKHNFYFGIQFLRSQDNHIAVSNLTPSATFVGFGNGLDSDSSSYPYGVTTGIFQSQTQNVFSAADSGERGYRQLETSLYARDNYKISRRLTLDMGIRWTYQTPFTEVKGYLNNAYLTIGGTVDPNAAVGFDNIANISLATSGSGGYSYTKKDWNNFAPNIGLNYDLSGKGTSVLSAGYSLAYERPNFTVPSSAGNVPYTLSTTLQAQRFGTTALNSTSAQANTPSLFVTNPANIVPYVQYWNLSLQQAVTDKGSLQLTYMGNKGTHLYDEYALNNGSGYTGTRPNSNYSTITSVYTDGIANYNALTAQFLYRVSHGLSTQLSYSWAKSLDTASTTSDMPVNERDRAGEYGPSDFDVRQVFAGNVSYKLPFGKEGSIHTCMSGFVCGVISGWQASTIVTAHTGQSFSVTSGLDNNGDGTYNERAYQLTPSLSQLKNTHGLAKNYYLNPAAVGVEIASTGTNMLRRHSFFGPKFTNVDVEARKTTEIAKGLNLIAIAQGFNLFNVTNFGLPNTAVNSGTFGLIQSTAVNGGSRVLQFSLRVEF